MRRVMVFIDFENFNIAVMSYYRSIGELYPRLDYNKVPQEIVKLIPGGNELVKTFLCAPKPDDFLAQDERRAGTYRLQGRFLDKHSRQWISPTQRPTMWKKREQTSIWERIFLQRDS